jgi:hypothetical protein
MVAGKKPDKPPGGGGGDTPAGTLYFVHDDGTGGAIWTMKGDGSDKTALCTYSNVMASLSRVKHGDHYWFLGYKEISGESYPDGIPRREVFAIRDDCTKEVQLTNDATMASAQKSGRPMWGVNDGYISWIAKRWVQGANGWELGDCGIWKQSIGFDSNGDVTGLTGSPSLVWQTTYRYSKSDDVYDPRIMWGHDWSPDGSKVAFQYFSTDFEIHVGVISSGTETDIADGREPIWSPDGNEIAFIEGTQAIKTINPDGTGEKTLVQVSNTKGWYYKLGYVAWSPDSNYVSYWWQKFSTKFSWGHGQNIYIIKTDGKGRTCLTNDLDLESVKVNRDWR